MYSTEYHISLSVILLPSEADINMANFLRMYINYRISISSLITVIMSRLIKTMQSLRGPGESGSLYREHTLMLVYAEPFQMTLAMYKECGEVEMKGVPTRQL